MNLSLLAQTASNCTLNGQPVDCAVLAEKAKPFIGFGIGLLVFFLVVMLVSFVFWLLMLIHALKHNSPDKTTWVVVLVVSFLLGFGLVGAILYFILEKKKAELTTPTEGQAPASASTPKDSF